MTLQVYSYSRNCLDMSELPAEMVHALEQVEKERLRAAERRAQKGMVS